MAAGMAVMGAATLTAADRYDTYRDRRDFREDYRDTGRDYARVNALRAEIARDQARLREDIRRGWNRAAERDAQELARDQRALDAQLRNLRRDQADPYSDRRDLRPSYGAGWR
jgi:hypothetical protein